MDLDNRVILYIKLNAMKSLLTRQRADLPTFVFVFCHTLDVLDVSWGPLGTSWDVLKVSWGCLRGICGGEGCESYDGVLRASCMLLVAI